VLAVYEYQIDQCDVLDKDRLNRYRNKRAEWKAWLISDDINSIWRQITPMLFYEALFKTIIDLRKFAAMNASNDVGFNEAVMRMIDAGFVAMQAMEIRRLTDKQSNDKNKSVISLRGLINDIRSNREAITREVYVGYDGLPYDYTASKASWIEQITREGAQRTTESPAMSGSKAWSPAELAHKRFDCLSKCADPTKRDREDIIVDDLFDRLVSLLDICQDVRTYADKFIAHSAEPANRADLTDSQTSITLNRLTQCHKAIYEVADFILGPLLGLGTCSPMLIPQYNHLANLEKAWLSNDQMNMAREFWTKNVAIIKGWSSDSVWPH